MEQDREQVSCWDSVLELLWLHILGELLFVGPFSDSQTEPSEKKMLLCSRQQSKFCVSSKQTLFTEFDLSSNDSEHV